MRIDEPDTVELVDAILGAEGFNVIKYESSEKALNSIKKGEKPDLILLDLRMPVISGPDFCTELNKAKIKLKIVFFTASSDLDKALAKKSGALGYIFKPFSNEDLVREIKKYLNG